MSVYVAPSWQAQLITGLQSLLSCSSFYPVSIHKVSTAVTQSRLQLQFLKDAAVIFPIRVRVPIVLVHCIRQLLVAAHVLARSDSPIRKTHLHLNFITVPLISVLLLLATGAIDRSVVRDGVVGANGVQPLDIMALFISLVRDSR